MWEHYVILTDLIFSLAGDEKVLSIVTFQSDSAMDRAVEDLSVRNT
jgi:hypothetical protein